MEQFRTYLDESVKPVDDFYRYVNGKWQEQNPIPPHESRWGGFAQLREQNLERLKAILENLSKADLQNGTNEQKLRDFYQSGMNEAKLESDGVTLLQEWFVRLDKVDSSEELVKFFAFLHRSGIAAPWHFYTEPDEKNSTVYSLRFAQNGLGLPDRDYYFKDDADMQRIRTEYDKHFVRMAALLPDMFNADELREKTLLIEKALAESSLDRVQRRDVEAQYNKVTIDSLAKDYPHLHWQHYFTEVGITNTENMVMDHVAFFAKLHELIQSLPIADFKVYLRWHILISLAGKMGVRFEEANFEFYGKVLSGLLEMQPRWKRVIGTIDNQMGEALGKLFVEKHFPISAKKRMLELVEDIKDAFAERITKLPWMAESTKEYALKKLSTYSIKIGYPDTWRDYSNLAIEAGGYLKNILASEDFDTKRHLVKLGKPVDRTEWFMTPPTVNAYHYPNYSEVVFPAGILQFPFFDAEADDAVNYGAIGSVIGHELTHGFDDKGTQYDAEGNFRNWRTEEDKKAFDERAEKLVEQANAFEVQPGLFLNGKLTLGENIADLGGAEIAYAAFKKALERTQKAELIEDFTPEQRFFMSLVRYERENIRPEKEREYALIDEHAHARFRTNQMLKNVPAFIETFGVKEGDGMYLEPEKRADIW